jgi:hypothetical protein
MQNTNILSFTGTLVPTGHKHEHHGLRDAIAGIFGCRHRELSRPFTRGKQTYLVCLRCGMRREFDLAIWKPCGTFYSEAPPPQDFLLRNGPRAAPVSKIHSLGEANEA